MRLVSVSFLICIILGLSLLACRPVHAQRSLECQRVWSQPSMNNEIEDCLSDSSRIGSQWRYYIYPGIAAVLMLFTITIMPIIFFCHCCDACCDCCVDHRKTSNLTKSRCWLWMWTTVVLIFTACMAVLIIVGSFYAMSAADKAFDDMQSNSVDYFVDSKQAIVDMLTDWSVDPPAVIPGIDLSSLDAISRDVSKEIDDFKDNYHKYFTIASIVSYCLGGIATILLVLLVVLALRHCHGRCPSVLSAFYWFFAFLFALIAVFFLTALYFVGAACGEVSLQYDRQPGIGQWLAVPKCVDKKYDFTSTETLLQTAITAASQQACATLEDYCDDQVPYDSTTSPQVIYTCAPGVIPAGGCTTLGEVSSAVLQTVAKAELNNLMCSNTSNWLFQEPCNVMQCAERCLDYEVPDLPFHTWTMEIASSVQRATNASVALSLVKPLSDCNFIIDKVVSSFESEKSADYFSEHRTEVRNCSNLHLAFVQLGTGYFVGSITFIIGVFILHKGSFMWNEEAKVPPEKKKKPEIDNKKKS